MRSSRQCVATATTIPTSEVSDVHVSAVVGDLVEELRPTMSAMIRDSDRQSYGMFDPRVFFQEPVQELMEFSFLVGDAPDDLSEAVATAVGIAAGHPNLVFRERYSFDPTRCRYPLEQLQRNAHWLVLASRQSLWDAIYAMQKAGLDREASRLRRAIERQ